MVEGLEGTGPIALRHDAWAPGIVGLIAGRLAETLERPVAVAAPAGDELRGSVRCPVDFHAAAALEACAKLLIKRGGHAAAGGFSLAMAAGMRSWRPSRRCHARSHPRRPTSPRPAASRSIWCCPPPISAGSSPTRSHAPGTVWPRPCRAAAGGDRAAGGGCAAGRVGGKHLALRMLRRRRDLRCHRLRDAGRPSAAGGREPGRPGRDARARHVPGPAAPAPAGRGLRREFAEPAGRSAAGCPGPTLQPVPMAAPAGATTNERHAARAPPVAPGRARGAVVPRHRSPSGRPARRADARRGGDRALRARRARGRGRVRGRGQDQRRVLRGLRLGRLGGAGAPRAGRAEPITS